MAQTKLIKVVLGNGGGVISNNLNSSVLTLGQPLTGFIQGNQSASNIGFWYQSVDFTTSLEFVIDENLDGYSLKQNTPNPFRIQTSIEFYIPQREHVNLTLYDLLGMKVIQLVNEELAPGKYRTTIETEDLTSGMYLYELKAGKFRETKTCLVSR